VDEQLARIARKLKIARQRPPSRIAGDHAHGYMLNPPLPEPIVASFERQHRIELPEGYRAFLTRMGNGGAGPFYGMLPLERWSVAVDPLLEGAPGDDLLERPSPLRDARTRVDWLELIEGRTTGLDPAAWHPYQGAIAVCREGGAYFALLVVTGPERGRVCNVDLELGPPKFSPQPGFLEWYEAWLDEVLSGKDLSGFGYA